MNGPILIRIMNKSIKPEKISLIFVVWFNLTSLNGFAQYTKEAFLDSLKNTKYLQGYFENNTNYNDSSYAEYLYSILPIDTFKVDSNSGFGFNPSSISILYSNSGNLNLYCGLSVVKGQNKKLKEITFYNHYGHKTALYWRFYNNGKIEIVHYYDDEFSDSSGVYGVFFSKKPSYRFTKYRKSGRLQLTGKYENGNKTGEWFYFDKKGILFKKEKYIDNKRVSQVSF